jgi:hypothetical protein
MHELIFCVAACRASQVQVNNNDAVAFYKKFGFEVVKTVSNYYKASKPRPFLAHCPRLDVVFGVCVRAAGQTGGRVPRLTQVHCRIDRLNLFAPEPRCTRTKIASPDIAVLQNISRSS